MTPPAGNQTRSEPIGSAGGSGGEPVPRDSGQDLVDILDQIVATDEAVSENDEVSMGELFKALDQRAYGPMLLIPGLISVSPIGMIPGASVVTGSLVILVSFQMLMARPSPWIPQRIQNFSFNRERLGKLADRIRPWLDRIDGLLKPRWSGLTHGWARSALALGCLFLGVTFFPLALIPFGVLLPGSLVCLIALAITTEDGGLILAAILLGALGATMGWIWLGN